jgi:CRP-like cAMP-binding protein
MVSGVFNVLQYLFDRFGLDSALIESCPSKVRNMYLEAGVALQTKDAEAGSLFYLASGLVVSTLEAPGSISRQHVVMAYDADTWLCTHTLAASYLQTDSLSDVSYIAATDVGLVVIEADLAQMLMERQSDFRNFVLKTCMMEAARQSQMLINFKFAGTVYRVVFGLAMMADVFCKRDRTMSGPFPVSHLPDISIALTQSMLGDICGVSRSSIVPILTELKTRGWLDLNYGNTVIRKPLAWCRLAESARDKKSINERFSMEDALKALTTFHRQINEPAKQSSSSMTLARPDGGFL